MVMKNDSKLEAEKVSDISTQALSLSNRLCGLSHVILATNHQLSEHWNFSVLQMNTLTQRG